MPSLRALLLAAALLGLGGCATMPDTLTGEFPALAADGAASDDLGTEVRWGGRLLAVVPEADRSCFEVLSRPLTDIARPVADEGRAGRRFLACQSGFADPAAYRADADITVIGTLEGFENRPVGDYEYRYPVLRVSALHVWPQRRELDPDPLPPPSWWYRDPYWYGYPYYYW